MDKDLPERLRTLAEHVSEWDHPITAKQDCLQAADDIEQLRITIGTLSDIITEYHKLYKHFTRDAEDGEREN